ncbi:MAG TPA: M28 family peptidase [Vicinamibacterales bacterium]|nr:M28 family peptidase [Vicinamibacterales bacterium]
MKSQWLVAVTLALACVAAMQATEPDAATRRWWSHVQALANDGMRGRDTGSPEHRRAQEYIARQFERLGVEPAGEQRFFQSVPLRSYRLRTDQSPVAVIRDGGTRPLRWLRDIAVAPALGLPGTLSGPLIFAGSDNAAGLDAAGAMVVRLNPIRLVAGPPVPAPPPGAAAILGVDSTEGPEPSRWPVQNATVMTPADASIPTAQGIPVLRVNPASAPLLFEGSGHTYEEMLTLSTSGRPVPSFPLRGTLSLRLGFEEVELRSDNVIGVRPGSDPVLATEYVVLSAHIDGYGLGEPWGRDRIYNGAFDDAAYVATLLDYAERLRETGTRLRRSLLFAVFTGEEKGLLGSRYYTRHLTVPRERLVANINLDQLRPVFPLHTLTMHVVDESSLGDTARLVGADLAIRIQADPEPLRNLMRRSDNFPFMEIGVPATGFVFGYQPGSSDEVAYRRWYRDRYHTPLDDLTQPWLPDAAAKFNEFFARMVAAVANADAAPTWKPGSPYLQRRVE